MSQEPAGLSIRPLDRSRIDDLRRLFESSHATDGCWCMWYIIPIKAYHAGRGDQNGKLFSDLVDHEAAPMGLLAYRGEHPVGWIAMGPRSRYARAVNTPTLRDSKADDNIWLVSCFYVPRDHRRQGIAGRLLAEAIGLAGRHGAVAIEGFPTKGDRITSSDSQVGTEAMFAAKGFRTLRQPSSNRVVTRLDLRASEGLPPLTE